MITLRVKKLPHAVVVAIVAMQVKSFHVTQAIKESRVILTEKILEGFSKDKLFTITKY
jgi:hypothetical protein